MCCQLKNVGHTPARVCLEEAISGKFHYWSGASGRAYLHTIFAPGACPAMPIACFIAVHRHVDGTRHVLAIGETGPGQLPAAGFGEAVVGRAATANEIHVHMLAGTADEAARIAADLSVRHLVCARAAS